MRVNERMLEWADVIFTMDELQREALREMFPSHPALDRLVCLEIPDEFNFLEPRLVKMLEEKVSPHLKQP